MKLTDTEIITLINTQQYIAKYTQYNAQRTVAESLISALSELLRLRKAALVK